MARVIPFQGLRYNTEKFNDLEKVTAPPYDIITPAQQQELYNQDEYNVIRLDYGMDFEGDNEENNKYVRSGVYLEKWIEEQVLLFEERPAFYIYEQVFSLGNDGAIHSLKGLISLVQLEEFSSNIVFPHEETISKAKKDRLELMKATGADLSQIYSLYADEDKKITAVITACSDREPDISFQTKEGVTQNIWAVTAPEITAKLTTLFEEKRILIADGHHRYETALNYRRLMHEKDGSPIGTMPYDYVMMYLVSMEESGLFVFPTHRMVKNVKDFDETVLVGFLTDQFVVSKIVFTEGDYAEIIADRLSQTVSEKLFAFYTGGDYYYLLELKDLAFIDEKIEERSEAYKHLDVTILHTLILEKYLGIDAESMKDQKNLVYTRSAHEAIAAVQAGEYQCSFLMNPPKVSDIRAVSGSNEKMPQKSTYFWPKPVTGIVMYKF